MRGEAIEGAQQPVEPPEKRRKRPVRERTPFGKKGRERREEEREKRKRGDKGGERGEERERIPEPPWEPKWPPREAEADDDVLSPKK